MTKTFDPYRVWFGISEQEQPPNHYRLLGLEDFESDPAQIQAAGEKRIQFLQDVSTGQYVAEAQLLLNQVAAAVVCLTNPDKKAAYDSRIQEIESPPVREPASLQSKRASKKPLERKAKAQKPSRKGKRKNGFPVWGYFVTIPVLIAASVGAFFIIKGKTGLPDKDSGVSFNQDWESGKTVFENFLKANSSARTLTSSIGSWELSDGVAINDSKVAGQKFLHLTGGSNRTATVRLSQNADRNGILTLSLRRWSSRVDFEFEVQSSSDGANWKTLPEASYSGKVPEGRQGGQVWSSVYELSDPTVTHLRLKCSSREYANKKQGGLLIDSMMIEPSLH